MGLYTSQTSLLPVPNTDGGNAGKRREAQEVRREVCMLSKAREKRRRGGQDELHVLKRRQGQTVLPAVGVPTGATGVGEDRLERPRSNESQQAEWLLTRGGRREGGDCAAGSASCCRDHARRPTPGRVTLTAENSAMIDGIHLIS